MENRAFNLSLRRFLKEVGVSSQQEIERLVRDQHLAGKGVLQVRMVLTADGAPLHHEVTGTIDLGDDGPHTMCADAAVPELDRARLGRS